MPLGYARLPLRPSCRCPSARSPSLAAVASVGGVQSLYNADSAAGHHVVIVVSAISLDDYVQGKLDTRSLRRPGDERVFVADEAWLAAIGPNALSTSPRAALDARAAQAQRGERRA